MHGLVLSLCDLTAEMVKPWAAAGYRCMIVDLQHKGTYTSGNITYVQADVRHWLPPKTSYEIVFGFPPCTHLSGSGARWLKSKGLHSFADAISIVEACKRICEWSDAPWMIENPVGSLSNYWRKPDRIFNPNQYGGYYNPPIDQYTKKTCLWTSNGFCIPPYLEVPAIDGSKMHKMGPSPERANLRSVTPAGFARAVFEYNSGNQQQRVQLLRNIGDEKRLAARIRYGTTATKSVS